MEIIFELDSPTSERTARFEDDGVSAWLYIIGTREILNDCFVYNRIPPIDEREVRNYEGGPPSITKVFATTSAQFKNINKDDIELKWSKIRVAVVVEVRNKPIAFLVDFEAKGYSKSIVGCCPWGNNWDESIWVSYF